MSNYIQDLDVEPGKLGAMTAILGLSLFAVSFPALSKQVPIIRIPHAVFFMGKHFGTGVILSTAFCHLLQDAFESLQHPIVKESDYKVGKWTGLIILSSLLAIFLVEYISTAYVDYIYADSSVSYSPLNTPRLRSTSDLNGQAPSVVLPEHSPLGHTSLLLIPGSNTCPTPRQHSHHSHHSREASSLPVELITNSRHRVRCCLVLGSCVCNLREEYRALPGALPGDDGQPVKPHTKSKAVPKSRPERQQLVGILVLQLGIMVHSLVIGLTLSITHGSDFASLFIAICFHQAFEGLSLGIRIDALPSSPASLLSTPKSPSRLSPLSESTQLLSQPSSSPTLYTPLGSPPHEGGGCLPSRIYDSRWMKTVLSILFAITTPFGMLLGAAVFPHAGHHGTQPEERVLMLLTQGVMSAISAGMLIYAATVEMMAGDFVFGDVSGGHPHPGHAHDRVGNSDRPVDVDIEREIFRGSEGDGTESDMSESELHDHTHSGHKPSSIRQKALAIASLLGGVAVMNITAIFE